MDRSRNIRDMLRPNRYVRRSRLPDVPVAVEESEEDYDSPIIIPQSVPTPPPIPDAWGSGERMVLTTEQQRHKRQIEKLRTMLGAYQKAVNQIDDRFEYRLGSTAERQFLNGVLEKLTADLKDAVDTYKDVVI